MKFYIYLFLLLTIFSNAQTSKIIIDAKTFEANDKKGLSLFTGNVKLVMNQDILQSDKLEIFLTPRKKDSAKKEARVPLKYIATGNVKFKIVTLLKHYEGTGDKIVYDPIKKEYIITGNGSLIEKNEKTALSGESIFINLTTGEAKLKGTDEKPVRFIINIQTKEEKK